MKKNVRVVDEQGNEYEATYPKRAKGLVKNGRARFVNENTICLACPPSTYLEDDEMSENTVLSEREVFEQIKLLQEQLLSENSNSSLYHLRDSLEAIGNEESETVSEQIDSVCTVFLMREKTLANLLDFYTKLYSDIRAKNAKQEELTSSAEN